MKKFLPAALSAALAFTLCSCSDSRSLGGTWIQDEGAPLERVLTIDEQSGTWGIVYTNSPASNVDGTMENSGSFLIFRLNNTVYLGEGRQPARTNPEVAKADRSTKEHDPKVLKFDIEDERGYMLGGAWERRD